MTNRIHLLPATILCLTIAFSTTGCRLYGGHGTTEATTAALTDAFAEFAGSLATAETGLGRLQGATQNHPELEAVVTQFANIVEDHKHSVDQKEGQIANLESAGFGAWLFGTPYRDANRLLGAVLSDHTTTEARYDDVLSELDQKIGATTSESSVSEKPYQAIPAYYGQNKGRTALTIDLILNHLAN